MPLTLPSALHTGHEADAVAMLRRYYGYGQPGFTGRWFDTRDPAGRRQEDPNCFTSDDLVAVSFLSIAVPAAAAHRALVDQAEELHGLLAKIPNVDLVDIDHETINRDWPAWRLWHLLTTGRDGIGWVTASKLLAYKRPRLLPVYDQLVLEAVGAPKGFWRMLNHALAADDHHLHRHVKFLRAEAGLPGTSSVLRVFDVVAWMTGE